MKLLLPQTHVNIEHDDVVFFLAGPIKGAGDWQKQACIFLSEKVPNAYIVCPSRYKPDHELYQHRMKGDENRFESQTEWERHYIHIAAIQGCLIFWLPVESIENPRKDGNYARETRGELGEWRGRLIYEESFSVVVGVEDGFPGLERIDKNFQYALPDKNFKIHYFLQETLSAAVQKIK